MTVLWLKQTTAWGTAMGPRQALKTVHFVLQVHLRVVSPALQRALSTTVHKLCLYGLRERPFNVNIPSPPASRHLHRIARRPPKDARNPWRAHTSEARLSSGEAAPPNGPSREPYARARPFPRNWILLWSRDACLARRFSSRWTAGYQANLQVISKRFRTIPMSLSRAVNRWLFRMPDVCQSNRVSTRDLQVKRHWICLLGMNILISTTQTVQTHVVIVWVDPPQSWDRGPHLNLGMKHQYKFGAIRKISEKHTSDLLYMFIIVATFCWKQNDFSYDLIMRH